MQSHATTVEQYLAELPEDRRAAISAVRQVILQSLDRNYKEGMQYGMIGYYVPHEVYPPGYHCNPKQPLPFASLASQKNYMSVHLMSVYGSDEEWFRAEWAKTGKKLDMGKCCVRFKKLDDLALDVIGAAIARVPVTQWVSFCESAIKRPAAKSSQSKTPSPAGRDKASGSAGNSSASKAVETRQKTRVAKVLVKKSTPKKGATTRSTATGSIGKSPAKKTPTKKAARKKVTRRT